MLLTVLKGKIHRAVVTQAELDYVGSITIDEQLMEAAGIQEYERVQVVDVENGRLVQPGDRVIIMAYALMLPEEARASRPKVVFVDARNHVVRVSRYEKHGRLEDM